MATGDFPAPALPVINTALIVASHRQILKAAQRVCSPTGDGWPDNRRGHPKDIHLSDLGAGERIEPPACRLQEVRLRAPSVLAAQMARIIALTALSTLGLSGAPVCSETAARARCLPNLSIAGSHQQKITWLQ